MRVFVTAAPGHIGSAVVAELLAAAHHVIGVVRSVDSAGALENAGGEPLQGTLEDVETLREAAAAADGVIHLAYMHNVPAHVDAAAVDLRAIEALGAGLEDSGEPFVGSSGTLTLLLAGDVDQPGPLVDASAASASWPLC